MKIHFITFYYLVSSFISRDIITNKKKMFCTASAIVRSCMPLSSLERTKYEKVKRREIEREIQRGRQTYRKRNEKTFY